MNGKTKFLNASDVCEYIRANQSQGKQMSRSEYPVREKREVGTSIDHMLARNYTEIEGLLKYVSCLRSVYPHRFDDPYY